VGHAHVHKDQVEVLLPALLDSYVTVLGRLNATAHRQSDVLKEIAYDLFVIYYQDIPTH
jgi:hypothetical protein